MYITYPLIKNMATMSQTADSRVRMHKDDYQLSARQEISTHKTRYKISMGNSGRKLKTRAGRSAVQMKKIDVVWNSLY